MEKNKVILYSSVNESYMPFARVFLASLRLTNKNFPVILYGLNLKDESIEELQSFSGVEVFNEQKEITDLDVNFSTWDKTKPKITNKYVASYIVCKRFFHLKDIMNNHHEYKIIVSIDVDSIFRAPGLQRHFLDFMEGSDVAIYDRGKRYEAKSLDRRIVCMQLIFQNNTKSRKFLSRTCKRMQQIGFAWKIDQRAFLDTLKNSNKLKIANLEQAKHICDYFLTDDSLIWMGKGKIVRGKPKYKEAFRRYLACYKQMLNEKVKGK